jgi:hypothetical protein
MTFDVNSPKQVQSSQNVPVSFINTLEGVAQTAQTFHVIDILKFCSLFDSWKIIQPLSTTRSYESIQSRLPVSQTLSDTELFAEQTVRMILTDIATQSQSVVAQAYIQKGTTTIANKQFAYEALRFDAKRHLSVVDLNGNYQENGPLNPAGTLHLRAGFDMKFLATYALQQTGTQLDLREQSVGLHATEHVALVDFSYVRFGKRHTLSTQTLPLHTYVKPAFVGLTVKQGKRTPLGNLRDRIYSFVYKSHIQEK